MKINYPIVVAVLIFLVMIILYPMSLGPIVWLNVHGHFPDFLVPVIEIVYAPLSWLFEHSLWYQKVHIWYISFWVDIFIE